MSRWTALVLTALLGLGLSAPAAAQWKWRDNGGRIQYSDLPPPPGVAEGDILQRPNAAQHRVVASASMPAASAAAASAPLLQPKGAEPELEAKRRKAEQEQAAKDKAEADRLAAARADNCVRARAQLRTLDSGVRIARTNEKGEREVMDDAGRAGETQRARAVVASDCK